MKEHITIGDVVDALPPVLGLLRTLQMALERDPENPEDEAFTWTLHAALNHLRDLKSQAEAAWDAQGRASA